MQRLRNRLSVLAFAGLVVFAFASEASAQRPNTREVRDIVRSLNAKVDDLSYNLTYQLRSSSRSRQTVEEAVTSLDNLKRTISTFENNLETRRENRDDVEEILTAARDVNGFLRGNQPNRNIENAWSDVQNLVNRLAGIYGVAPDWNARVSNSQRDLPARNDDYDISANDQDDRPARPSNTGSAGFTGDLTGTYDIDRSRSESAADIMRDIQVSGSQRTDLQAKLEAPQQIAIGVSGSEVTLASSTGTPITFVADGTEKTEQVDGRTLRVRATLRGDELTVSSLGGETDYTVTFASEDGGRSLKVTRRITTEYLNETIFVDSVYTKSDQVARLGIENVTPSDDTYSDGSYSSNDPTDRGGSRPVGSPNPTLSKPRIGEFLIANGTSVTGVLDTEINTRASQNNDRFRLTVQTPMEYRGAVIEGYISGVGRSGQISGRSNVTFNFERITLRDGKSYDFSGTVVNIKDASGKDVRVDNEGTAKGDSQTRETAKRGGIGAGLGALIGAIAGGGKGAVIGAIIGGGAGAGSVAIMGRDDVRLMPGSTITITSSSPIREPLRRDN
jgi:hypothetical protein